MNCFKTILTLIIILISVLNSYSQVLVSEEMLDHYELIKKNLFGVDLDAKIAFPFEEMMDIEAAEEYLADYNGPKYMKKQIMQSAGNAEKAMELLDTELEKANLPIPLELVFLNYDDHVTYYIAPSEDYEGQKHIQSARNLLNYPFMEEYKYVLVGSAFRRDKLNTSTGQYSVGTTDGTYYLLDNENMAKYKVGMDSNLFLMQSPSNTTRFLVNKLVSLIENDPK